MYNLIEYSSNYSEATGSLWLFSNDEATDFNNNITNTDCYAPICNNCPNLQ